MQNAAHTDEQGNTVKDRTGLTPFGLRAYIMGVLPQASGFMVYVILTHDSYSAMWYAEVPMDWVTLSEEITCMLTVVLGYAFLEKNVPERLEKTPALQIYDKLRTRQQYRTLMEYRYKSGTLEKLLWCNF